MQQLELGAAAIDFTLPGTDDHQHALADYAEYTAVAIIFSCNHCPYVRAWEDRMNMIQREYASRGVQLIAINANDAQKYPDDSFEKMQQRAHEKQFAFPYLYDASQETARAYGAQRTPEVFLFDAARTLRYHGAIDDNYENPDAVRQHYLRAALDALLAGHEPAPSATPPVGCTIKWR
jgi:peroxiredoxin